MKVKFNERKKKKRIKLITKKSKTRLTVPTKKHSCKNKNIFSDEAIMNPINVQSISSAKSACSVIKKAAKKLNFKHKQKQSSSKEGEMTDSMERSISENEEMSHDQREDRNLDSTPCVVEMLSDGITSLNLPEILQIEQKPDKETFHSINTSGSSALSNEEDTCVMISKSIDPKCDTRVQINRTKEASPVPSSMKKKSKDKKTSSDHLKDVNASDTSNSSTPRRKRNRNKKRKSLTNCNDNTKVHSSFQHINALQQESVDAIQQENISVPPFVSTPPCKSNKKLPAVYCIRNIVIVIMEKESGFCFIGKLLVKVLYGAVKIYGYVLDSSTVATKVYSPRGYNHVAIETTEASSKGGIEDIWIALASEGITRDSESILQIDIDNVQPGMAVLVLQNFENNLTYFLRTYFPHFRLFPTINNPYYYSWTDPRRAERILQTNMYSEQHDEFKYKRLIFESFIAEDLAERMLSLWYENEWSCTMVMGGKGVGKSTNVRYLINTLLHTTKVVLVDVDPGQSECTPPSCISYSLIEEPLMGPNFTHLKTPVYQLFLDEVNIAPCVIRYFEGIKMLIERLKACPILSRLPIVVNTMGFVQNLGWDIAIFTIKLIRPSFILQIETSRKNGNYKEYLTAEIVNQQACSTWTFCDEKFLDWNRPCEHNVCVIHSQTDNLRRQNKCRHDEGIRNIEPYQQRELAMMSYLSGIIRESDSFQIKWPISINETVPHTAPFSSLCIIPKRLFGVPPSHALSVINGNIVALCGVDLMEESSQESDAISSLRILTQRSSLCTCYGFGIIRGVDMERQEVYINTPLPLSSMQYVNCLAGCIPVPPALLQLHHRAPYVGGNADLPTSRESRRGGFRVKAHKKKTEKCPNE